MGTGSAFTSTPVETDLFFSRRIGLSDAGTPIPIIGGARVAGKSERNNIGVLDIQTDDAFGRPGDELPGRRATAATCCKRSRVGAIFVNKESMGGGTRFNRTIGADANLALEQEPAGADRYLAKTDTPGMDGQDMAFFGRIAYRDPAWNLCLNYLDVQDNFNAEVGFVQRHRREDDRGLHQPDAAARQVAHPRAWTRCSCSPTSRISPTGWSDAPSTS
mgnify:CR=1 FL=1